MKLFKNKIFWAIFLLVVFAILASTKAKIPINGENQTQKIHLRYIQM